MKKFRVPGFEFRVFPFALSLSKGSVILALLLGISGCALLMPPNPYTKEVIAALAADDASACVRVNLSGGGAGAAVGPGVIPAGGYGSVGFTLGRSGQDGMQIYVGPDGSCQVRSKDKDFLTPSSPLPSFTMHGLGTGAIAPRLGNGGAEGGKAAEDKENNEVDKK
jgi:hypothetical protein